MSNEKIFISYSRRDKDKVFAICEDIEKIASAKCWIDLNGIESDQQFVDVILNAIKSTECFVFMYSPNSAKSEWTKKELNFAAKKGKKIVFVNLDGGVLEDWFEFHYGEHDIIDINIKEQKDKFLHNLKEWYGEQEESIPETFFLKVKPNRTCSVYLDEEEVGVAEANKLTRFPLSKGEYTFRCIAEDSGEEIEQEDVVILDCDILRKPLFSKENQSEIQTHSTSNEQNAKESVDETDKTVGCSESVIVPPTSSESVLKANKDKSENIQKVSGASDVFYDVVLIEQTEKVKGWGEILEEFYVDGMPFEKDWIYAEELPMMFRYHLSKSDAEQMCASIQKVGFKTEMVVSEIPVIEILKVESNGKNKIIIESTLSTKYPPVLGFYNADVYCGDLIDEFGAVTYYDDGSQRHYTEINLNDISGIPKT